MATRSMIDVTHANLQAAMSQINALPSGSLVGLYDTGSPDIVATIADIKEVPSVDHVILIDQGFTGSPNFNATVRDCENGAWSLAHAVNKTNWNVPRPTLYLGFPDTMAQAAGAGWKGDVWVVNPQSSPPTVPVSAPAGLNVVAEQWQLGPTFDRSVVFDATWPLAITPPPPPHTITQSGWRWCNKCQGLFYGPGIAKSHCPAGGQHDLKGSGNYSLEDLIT